MRKTTTRSLGKSLPRWRRKREDKRHSLVAAHLRLSVSTQERWAGRIGRQFGSGVCSSEVSSAVSSPWRRYLSAWDGWAEWLVCGGRGDRSSCAGRVERAMKATEHW